MKFSYKELPAKPGEAFPDRNKIFRPIIPVVLEYKDKKVGYEALLDTGADWNIFPSVIGEIIGIDVPTGKSEKFGGIGAGNYTAYFHEVLLYVGGWPIKAFCGFSADIRDNTIGVLGHAGFFNHFVAKFETAKRELELKQIK